MDHQKPETFFCHLCNKWSDSLAILKLFVGLQCFLQKHCANKL